MQNALIICYLFLGGVGAGAFLVLTVISWCSPKPELTDASGSRFLPGPLYRLLIAPGLVTATVVQFLGILCLVFDMGRPERILILVLEPYFSVVSVGAYALAILLLCSVLLSLYWMGGLRVRLITVRALGAVGAVAACGVMLYTGLLLQSFRTVSFWSSPLIPVLFVLSATSTGVALMSIVMHITHASLSFVSLSRRLNVADMVLIAFEMICLSALLFFGYRDSGSIGSVETLMIGRSAELFWVGLVLFGLVIPLVIYASPLVKKIGIPDAVPPILVLVGGLCLRICIVGAGY